MGSGAPLRIKRRRERGKAWWREGEGDDRVRAGVNAWGGNGLRMTAARNLLTEEWRGSKDEEDEETRQDSEKGGGGRWECDWMDDHVIKEGRGVRKGGALSRTERERDNTSAWCLLSLVWSHQFIRTPVPCVSDPRVTPESSSVPNLRWWNKTCANSCTV